MDRNLLFLCFQKLVSGELPTFYSGRFPRMGIEPGTLELGTQWPAEERNLVRQDIEMSQPRGSSGF